MDLKANTDNPYNVKVPVFEGPMDLLLHLIRENKLDIYDIPIALITRQYLEYIDIMKELNLEIAGEFLLMASTLIHIKSRMLLPIEETAETEEPEDPRLELVQKLLRYQEIKDAALGLRERAEEWTNVFVRGPAPEEEELSLFDLNIFDLLSSFKKVLEKAPVEIEKITREALSTKDKISFILNTLAGVEAVRFEDLFRDDPSRPHMLVTFVALLEILRLGLAKVYQEREFGQVWVIRSENQNPY